MSTYINFYTNFLILLNRFDGSVVFFFGRPPIPLAAWIYQLHAAGGAIGSTTMVMVLIMLFLFFVWSCLVIVA